MATSASLKKKVLITGASGSVGRSLALSLREHYDLRLHYHRNVPDRPPVDDIHIANISVYEDIAPAMAGVDAVVHMAADSSPFANWDSVRDHNIIGTFNVFESARLAGVNKVIFASTNHVMGMYDRDRQWPIYNDQPVRPDSLYGVSKAFGESLARHYSDRYGMSMICLRIGWFLERPVDEIGLWMWLSHRDGAQAVARAIECSLLFGIFYTISRNTRRHWDLTETIEKLGYRPEDDSEIYAKEILGNAAEEGVWPK
jgi:NAD+ dependent glucose-6-phosphate dehydrogenase